MEIQEFLDELFARAREAGLEDYEAYVSATDSFRVTVREAAVEDYRVNHARGVGFRVLTEGKAGYTFTRALDADAVDMLIRDAFENAKIAESGEPQFLWDGSGIYQPLVFDTAAVDAMSAAEKIEMAKQLEAAALAHKEVLRVHSSVVVTVKSEIRIQNSRGLKLHFEDSMLMGAVSPIVKNGDGFVNGSDFCLTRDPGEVDVEKIAQGAVEEALLGVGAEPLPSGSYPVILRNSCISDLLGTFCGIFSAENVHKGLSALKGKVGEKIASDCVTLLDDPLLPDGYASRPFDDEGVPCYTKEVISGGILKTLLHNLKTAAMDGVKSTGNAAKAGISSPVTVAPTNFYVRPGTASLSELEAKMGNGLVITDVSGLHAGANPTSGDFSLICEGYEVRDGKFSRPVNQMTVSGNFYELLLKIREVGNDLRFDSSCVASPSVWVENMPFAGK